MVKAMKSFSTLAMLMILCVAHADRFITIPTGTKIRAGTIRTEIQRLPSDNFWQGWLGYGINQNLDAEIGESWLSGKSSGPELNFGYNYVLPITDISPGISFGVQDFTNTGKEGRAAYMAITYSYGNDGDYNQDTPTQLTFGFWTRRSGLLFVGLSLPFSEQIRLIAAHDGAFLMAGVEYRPTQATILRVLTQESRLFLSLSLSQKL